MADQHSTEPDILEVECKQEENIVTFLDGKDSISFKLRQGQEIDFIVLKDQTDTAHTRIIGIEPNVSFSQQYIDEHSGKTTADIPEVSELVNIIMVLHPDAENENNMFDTSTDYYQRVKTHFKPYTNHPVLDTIQKYITDLQHMHDYDASLFSEKSYRYYYALKMNACAYAFADNGSVENQGFVQQMAKGWAIFDPMKDVALFADFARQSNFRQFYQDNKPYYDSLLTIYNDLNPIQQMQDWLDKKFDMSYGSYAIYFSPLTGGAHSTQRLKDDNFSQTFMFIARADRDDKYTPVMNELLESRVVFTEIDHNYVNPTTDKFIDRVNASFSNREKWAKGSITSAYPTPYTVFNEYMTFAVYTLYVLDTYSEEDVLAYIPLLDSQMQDNRGFIRFKDFNHALLEKYKQDKAISIPDLYDYILTWSLAVNNE